MLIKINCPEWRRWLDPAGKRYRAVLNILRYRYADERQHSARLNQHAEKMRYPQFRDAPLSLAAEEEKHAESIGAKIRDLAENLPDVIPICVARDLKIRS